MAATATRRRLLVLLLRRPQCLAPLRAISVFVDSQVIDSYGKDDDEDAKVCSALSLGTGRNTGELSTVYSQQRVLRRVEPDAVAGIAAAKETLQDGTALRQLRGSKSFRPGRLDNQLVNELSRLLGRGDVLSWEAEDVVRTYGAVLMPYHVCEVLKVLKNQVDVAYAFFKWCDFFEGFKHDTFSCTSMIKLLGKNKKYEEIKNVLFGMEDQMIPRNHVTYNTLVGIYIKAGMVQEALEAFHELEQCELCATVEDYKYFMHSLIMLDHPQLVPLVFNSMRRKKVEPDLQAFNIAVNSYSKLGRMDEALELYKSMKGPDEYTYGALINGFCKCSDPDITIPLLKEMLRKNLKPNEAIYNMMMDAHYRVGKHGEVCRIFKMMLDQELEPDAKSYRVLIDSFEDAGKLADLCSFFKTMVERGQPPSAPAYNILMTKLAKSGKEQTALQLFEDMQGSLQPSLVSYNIALDLLCQANRVDDAWNIYSKTIKKLSMADRYTYNTLISRFGKTGKLDRCLELLNDMHKDGIRPDEYTYTGLVDAHSKSGKTDLALRFLEDMKAAGYIPTASTLDMLVHSLLKAGKSSIAETLIQELEAGKYVPRKINEGRPKTPKLGYQTEVKPGGMEIPGASQDVLARLRRGQKRGEKPQARDPAGWEDVSVSRRM